MARRSPPSAPSSTAPVAFDERQLTARPDLVDFRDRMYEPTLIEVPRERSIQDYRDKQLPVLDQQKEGACTGFGLAAVANYLLRTRKDVNAVDKLPVSPRMFYNMARRYDEYPGDDTDGSSPRGAMKGWHKHGVCRDDLWPYRSHDVVESLTDARARDAAERPLGAYLRVNHRDLVAMHCAICEVGILYAAAFVHTGWKNPSDGLIEYRGNESRLGGHAFAIVAYDAEGFWIQNSWGTGWGQGGFARLKYGDWLDNGADVWVARLGVPVSLDSKRASAAVNADASSSSTSPAFQDIRPHIISIGNNGRLQTLGTYATSPEDVRQIFQHDVREKLSSWKKPRLMFYAHGGLTNEASAVQRIAEYAQPLLDSEIYPIMFSWRSDYWSTISNILHDSLRRRTTGGVIEATKNFLLDRLDDALEPIARGLTGKLAWEEMKQNALAATTTMDGAARHVAWNLARLKSDFPQLEIHLTGHSAGAILLAPLVRLLTEPSDIQGGPLDQDRGFDLTIDSCTLWAPACTAALFMETYGHVLAQNTPALKKLRIFTLSDAVEQNDDCNGIYHKSLLYLVSHAFEEEPRIPFYRPLGIPLVGMSRTFLNEPTQEIYPDAVHLAAVRLFHKLYGERKFEWVETPNTYQPELTGCGSTAQHHGAFDDDFATLMSLQASMLGTTDSASERDAVERQHQLWESKLRQADNVSFADSTMPKRGMTFERSARSSNQRRVELEGKLP